MKIIYDFILNGDTNRDKLESFCKSNYFRTPNYHYNIFNNAIVMNVTVVKRIRLRFHRIKDIIIVSKSKIFNTTSVDEAKEEIAKCVIDCLCKPE